MTTTPPQPPQPPPFQPGGGGFTPPPGQPQYQQPQYPQQGQPQPGQPQPGQPQQFPQYGPGGQYGQPQQPPQYAPPPYNQQQYNQQQYAPPQPQPQYAQGPLQCRFCGGVPAVQATVRGHQGIIILMRLLKLQGPFCKTCGTAATRDMTAKSLWQGWWSIGSMIINPVTLIMNLVTSSKFRNLPEPAPGAPGRPMNPGKPLIQRPAVLGLLIPVALIAFIVVANLTKSPDATVGSCVTNKGSAAKPDVEVVECTSTEADYKVVGKIDNTVDGDQCAKFETSTVSYTDSRKKFTLCLAPR
ncbi:LppU/SCO3897 family protein [Kribbella sp. CA-293567]|uniref:LppU/SCO3897 family protein n=1 Tax=Kribbella sp. CA-293567 TaxID=3002436 RepID=UPI0022DD18A8|nr:toxin-antitoxin system, toxin component [Kribbella sp. CA-293567]WBQ01956.1 toxin-antitoxin system, toxin component [Kribbella sp. CA-293567]